MDAQESRRFLAAGSLGILMPLTAIIKQTGSYGWMAAQSRIHFLPDWIVSSFRFSLFSFSCFNALTRRSKVVARLSNDTMY